MVFSSVLFLFYFLPAFLLIYFVLPNKLKNTFILLASICFYAWGAPKFIALVLASIIIDFYLVKFMVRSSGRRKILLLSASVVLNVGMLAYFKYANFFVENFNLLLESLGFNVLQWVKVALPIGISFFTFQKMSYAIDIYRGIKIKSQSLVDYAMYILMFSQLIAGPIVRYHEIADQVVDRRYNENFNNCITGLFRFAVGLAKKVLIANVLGEQADFVFGLSEGDLTSSLAWIGILAYTFQIYFDFSGYSDMAIGLGRIMGFDFPENFNNPYISKNISEFWRRWHITLGNWMREYLYIPLGGNRVTTKRRLYFNLWLVFLISGLWHGAAWNFIIWGIYHGLFMVADRIFLIRLTKRFGNILPVIICFIVVMVGWVFFRSETIEQSLYFIDSMFSFNFSGWPDFDTKFYSILILAFGIAFVGFFNKVSFIQDLIYSKNQNGRNLTAMYIVSLILIILSSFSIVSSDFNPFIYFRF